MVQMVLMEELLRVPCLSRMMRIVLMLVLNEQVMDVWVAKANATKCHEMWWI